MEYSAAASNVRPLALAYQHDLLRTASGDVHPAAYHSSGASHPPDVSAALRVMSLSSVAKSSAKKVVIGKYDHRKPRKWAQSTRTALLAERLRHSGAEPSGTTWRCNHSTSAD